MITDDILPTLTGIWDDDWDKLIYCWPRDEHIEIVMHHVIPRIPVYAVNIR